MEQISRNKVELEWVKPKVQQEKKSKIRVKYITSSLAPYRIPVFQELAKTFDLTILLNGTRHEIHPWDNTEIPDLNTRTMKHWKKLCFARREIIVVTPWNDPRVMLICFCRKFLSLTTISIYESTLNSHVYKKGIFSKIRRMIFRSCFSAVVTVGIESTKAVRAMGVKENLIFEGFNAVDNQFFSSRTNYYRNLNQRDVESRNCILIGRLIPLKNFDLAIQAWADARRENDKLFIVGDGPERERLSQRVKTRGIEDFVVFTGYLNEDEICKLFAECTTLLLVSEKEVWGLVANEALASGLHIVISESCGATSSLKNMSGVFTCTNSIESIVTALQASQKHWTGPIKTPEILQYGPKELAQVIESAILGMK